ncbi:MAG: tRNA pseudouridine(38-40) synthase TruA [Melioribacteraceae bacterium]|nr:tRNA pseudouridine(38-40) synthase TruA [Melioribacteraceae bacterium]
MHNYKLTIQYKGTNYAGWQIQKNVTTVQQVIVDAVKQITGQSVNLIGAGRTDAGVHALGQTANFRIEESLDLYKFKHSLNSVLPYDISVSDIAEVDHDFHARFNAKKRSYFYIISSAKSPFYHDFSYTLNITEPNFIDRANRLLETIVGEHDFASFSKQNPDVNSYVCSVYDARWKHSGSLYYFFIEANRFMHGMVRAITGTVIEAVKLNAPDNYLLDVLAQKKRGASGMAVPAKGLFLFKVKY